MRSGNVGSAGRKRTSGARTLLHTAALGMACALILSGCFLRSLVGFVDERGGTSLSGNVRAGFCDFNTSIEEFWGCTYTISGLSGGTTDITSTFQLVTELGVLGLIIDPLIFQVPADATNVMATYNNAGSDQPAVVIETTSFPVTPGQTVQSEPGTKFIIMDLPDSVVIPPGGADFDFALTMDVANPANLVIKPMFTARVDVGGVRYYPPIFPCVTDFSQIPGGQIPVNTQFQDLRPVFQALIDNAAQLTCNRRVYNFVGAAPTTTTTTTTTAPTPTTAPPTTAPPTTPAPTTAPPTTPAATAPPTTPAPAGAPAVPTVVPELPATGSSTPGQTWLALLFVLAGFGLVMVAVRRPGVRR